MTTFMSAAAAAQALGVTPATVSAYCRDGLLPGAIKPRPGSPWRIPEHALAQLGTPTPSPDAIAPRRRHRKGMAA